MSWGSEEVLSSPPERRRPVLRALVAVVALGLVAWGAAVKLSENGASQVPAAAPPAADPFPGDALSADPPEQSRPITIPPPPWVRYPNPLEGRWVVKDPPGQVTLVISNSRLTLFEGTHRQPERHSFGLRTITVSGNRVSVRPPTDEGETATYRWHIRRDRLTFELVERTPKAALRLESLDFHRV